MNPGDVPGAPVLVDTDVVSWIALGEQRADEFAAFLTGHAVFVSFVTVAVDDLVDSPRRDVDRDRQPVVGDPEGHAVLLQQHLSRMDRRHGRGGQQRDLLSALRLAGTLHDILNLTLCRRGFLCKLSGSLSANLAYCGLSLGVEQFDLEARVALADEGRELCGCRLWGPSGRDQGVSPVFEEVGFLEGVGECLVEGGGGDLDSGQRVVRKKVLKAPGISSDGYPGNPR